MQRILVGRLIHLNISGGKAGESFSKKRTPSVSASVGTNAQAPKKKRKKTRTRQQDADSNTITSHHCTYRSDPEKPNHTTRFNATLRSTRPNPSYPMLQRCSTLSAVVPSAVHVHTWALSSDAVVPRDRRRTPPRTPQQTPATSRWH